MLDACASVTEFVSAIDWPTRTAFGAWVRELQGQRNGPENVTALVCLSRLDVRAQIIHFLDLYRAVLNGSVLDDVGSAGVMLNNASLNGASLNDANLNNADLSSASLNNASLNNADLHNADLADAELNNAELNGAKLRYASMNNAELNSAELNSAKLDGADLNFAALNNAGLNDAELRGAKITPQQIAVTKGTPAVLPDGTRPGLSPDD